MNRKARFALLAIAIAVAASVFVILPTQAQEPSPWTVSVSCPQITFSYDFGEGRATNLEYASINQAEYEGFVYQVVGPEGYNIMGEWPDPQVPVSVDVGVPGVYTIYIGYQFTESGSLSTFRPSVVDIFDSIQVEVDCPVVTGFDCPVKYAILGSVLVNAAQPGFYAPGAEQARDSNNNPIVLPIDADGGGVDEYLIIKKATLDGEEWFGLFIGGCNPVWAPASKVIRVR